ncbi:MAG: FHA domain-containing protein [Scytolyngbya sp. HA4215-MV1]|jgi:hypothetical protein|nr:FHA domain-containing protein [Scytolyngbya sp. HA4215-MV1]
MLNFVDVGYLGLLVRNGKLVRQLSPGRYFHFVFPCLDQCKLILVDMRTRNLQVISRKDFLSRDQVVVNVSLNVTYQVLNAAHIALRLSEPLTSLTATLKDLVGLAIAQLDGQVLMRSGRTHIRECLLAQFNEIRELGFQIADVRLDEISFPEQPKVHQRSDLLNAHSAELLQASYLESAMNPLVFSNSLDAETDTVGSRANFSHCSLVHQKSGEKISLASLLSTKPYLALGRELDNDFVIPDRECSRHHAQVFQFQGIYYLMDVGSTNGTYVDGKRLVPQNPTRLRSGVTVQIGQQTWQFEEKILYLWKR